MPAWDGYTHAEGGSVFVGMYAPMHGQKRAGSRPVDIHVPILYIALVRLRRGAGEVMSLNEWKTASPCQT